MQPTIQIGLCQFGLKTRDFWCGIRGNKVVLIDLAGAAHLVVISRYGLLIFKEGISISGLYR